MLQAKKCSNVDCHLYQENKVRQLKAQQKIFIDTLLAHIDAQCALINRLCLEVTYVTRELSKFTANNWEKAMTSADVD